MSSAVTLSLPIGDRAVSYAFYRQALGWDAVGEPGDDGVPEPLQFAVNDGLRVMLVPRGGFAWVIGGADVAEPGQHECVLALAADSPAAVDAAVARAVEAGATVVAAPGQQPWGYVGSFADPDGHVVMVRAD